MGRLVISSCYREWVGSAQDSGTCLDSRVRFEGSLPDVAPRCHDVYCTSDPFPKTIIPAPLNGTYYFFTRPPPAAGPPARSSLLADANHASAAPSGFLMGLAYVKNKNLIVTASPRCTATTTMRSTLLVWRSVADSTGYKFHSRKATDRPKPTATKTQLRMSTFDQLMSATGIQIRFP